MAEKCFLCEGKIDKTFLDKIKGTIVKIKNQDKNEHFCICIDCQKKHKDKLKEQVKNKL